MTQVVHLLDTLGLFLAAPSKAWEREERGRGFFFPVLFVFLLSLGASLVQIAWHFNGRQVWGWGDALLASLTSRTSSGRLASLSLSVVFGTGLVFLDAVLLRVSHQAVLPREKSGSSYETYFRLVAFSLTATLWTVFTTPLMVSAGRRIGWTLGSVALLAIPGLFWRAALLVKGGQVLIGAPRAASIESTLIFLALGYSVRWVLGLAPLLLVMLFRIR